METETIHKVRAILLREGRIAVTQSRQSKAFMLPGGKVEAEEADKETLSREICEELGIEIEHKDIVGPFYRRGVRYVSQDEEGNAIYKKMITTFYIINTTQDFDYEKMNLTPREIARESRPYWVNPAKLEYLLTIQRDSYQSKYASQYAQEFLTIYQKFKQYQIKSKEEELEK